MDPVTENEKELKKWKENTRLEALENEVNRLKWLNSLKLAKIKKLTIALYATIAFFIASLATSFWLLSSPKEETPSESAIQLPNKQNATETAPIKRNRELNIISPISDTIKFRIPENGIIFSIQIGAYLNHDLQKFSDNMVTLHQYSSENINQFTLGLFTSYTEAMEFRNLVKQLGFSDAYVTALKNGRRINIQEAEQESDLHKKSEQE